MLDIKNVLSLFDGMSCGQIALNKLGIKYENYYASEIDKYGMQVSKCNFPNTIYLGDVKKIETENLPKIDLLIGGSPCQSFSFAGRMNGMTTTTNIEITDLETYMKMKSDGYEFIGQSYLFWEYIRILKEVKPTYFLLENVNMSEKWEKVITKTIGVDCIMINSNLLSAQNRKRLYWTNIPNVTQPLDKGILLKDIMTTEGEYKYPTQVKMDYFQRKVEKGWISKSYIDSNTEKSVCVLATTHTQMQGFIWKDDNGKLRFFHVNELETLQTVPTDYTKYGLDNDKVIKISNTQRFKMLGNGWTVDVIAHIFSFLPIYKNNIC